jgi:hypothetical protein
MKLLLATSAFYVTSLASGGCFAQATFVSSDMQCYELRLANVAFDGAAGDSYSIPLRKYGMRKSNYAVLVKAEIEGDLCEYHIPGELPNGDSFSFKLKAGTKQHGDTLVIIRRSGSDRIQFSRISILAYRNCSAWPFVRNDKAFRKFFLGTYASSYIRPDLQEMKPDLKSQRTARIIKLID